MPDADNAPAPMRQLRSGRPRPRRVPRRGLFARLRAILARRRGKRPNGELTYIELHPEVLRMARTRQYAVKPKERTDGL